MKIRTMIAAGALAAALAIPAAAEAAWFGVAATNVSLRTGPGVGFGRIAVVPAGARLTVFRCGGWCHVRFGGITGWINARYVASGGGVYAPGRVIVRPPPAFWGPTYPGPYWSYPYRPWHRPWYRPGVNFWFGF